MLKVYLIIACLITTASGFSQTTEESLIEQKKIWQKTGYGFQELFGEPDFQTTECIKSKKMYLACLETLNELLVSLDSGSKVLEVSEVGNLNLSPLVLDLKSLSPEELEELKTSWRAQYLKASNLRPLEPLAKVFKEVQSLLEASVPKSDQAFVAGTSFDSFLRKAFDPHTAFAPAGSTRPKVSNYVGAGAFIRKFDDEQSPLNGAIALSPMKGSPAEAAGIKKGDLVLAVDGMSVLEKSLDEAKDLILGPEGTKVIFRVQRICTGREEEVAVTRGSISYIADWTKDSYFVSLEKDVDPIDEICDDNPKETKKGEPQALYVPMTSFVHRSGNTMDLCREFVLDLQRRDLENPDSLGMIIDLRGNGGGFLQDVACMLDTIVSESKGTIIGQKPVRRGELVVDAPVRQDYKFDFVEGGAPVTPYKNTRVHYNKKIVVLTDGSSASASEIFSGSIQDLQRGWVVGDRTYGKGSVQTVQKHFVKKDFRSRSDTDLEIRRTIAIYTLNSGRSPQNLGIIPDFRFDDLGEPVVDKDGDKAGEALLENTIEFNESLSVQQARPKMVKQMSDCTQEKNSLSENLKERMKQDDRYKVPFVSSFQMSLAMDVMSCAPARESFK